MQDLGYVGGGRVRLSREVRAQRRVEDAGRRGDKMQMHIGTSFPHTTMQ
jgi:hypothetical protein